MTEGDLPRLKSPAVLGTFQVVDIHSFLYVSASLQPRDAGLRVLIKAEKALQIVIHWFEHGERDLREGGRGVSGGRLSRAMTTMRMREGGWDNEIPAVSRVFAK